MEVYTVWLDTEVGERPLFRGVFSSLEKAREWADAQEGAKWGYIYAMKRVVDEPVDPDPWTRPCPITLRQFHESRPDWEHT
jgi:hypothetical protein